VVRYKDSIVQKIIGAMSPVARTKGQPKEYPTFLYKYRSLGRVFMEGALFDMAWLVFFNILFFGLSYFAFAKYDVR
jgi:hypothetical protein